jgi:membrane dipeptidase
VFPIPDLEKYMERQRAWVAERVKAGIAAPGENEGAPFFVVDLTGPDQFRKLAALLEKRGHPPTRIEKILGKNFVRVAREVWGA